MQKPKRKEASLQGRTKILIETMKRLHKFSVNDLVMQEGLVRRRVFDVVAILCSAGFLKKSKEKMHYVFVGKDGVRDVAKGILQAEGLEDAPQSIHYYTQRLIHLLVNQDTWYLKTLLKQICKNESIRRGYDVIAVFLGAELLESVGYKSVRVIIFGAPAPPRARMILKVSDEDAMAILPELEAYLKNHNEDVFTF